MCDVYGLMRIKIVAFMYIDYQEFVWQLQSCVVYSEWVRDHCLTPNEQFLSYIMARTSYIRWDDNDDVRLY
jgi:transglutaminase-like putative cysteine protease